MPQLRVVSLRIKVVLALPPGRSGPLPYSDSVRRQVTSKTIVLIIETLSSTRMDSHYLRHLSFNTLRPRQNGRHFADDTFNCIFLNENV